MLCTALGPSRCTKISELVLLFPVLGTLDSFDKHLLWQAECNEKCISSFLLESFSTVYVPGHMPFGDKRLIK